MKKKIISFLLIAVLICTLPVPAFAASGDVTYTTDGKMAEENFNVDQVFSGLEPGDDAVYYVNLHNRNSKTTRWYMSNTVLQSLEDSGAASGGASTYRLTFPGPGGTSTTLYDSSRVGGDNPAGSRVGLHEATNNLENYFFLDTLNSGENGLVTLYVALEGETQDNSYQNTAARIRMNFAVEATDPGGNRTSVKTGDETNLMPYYIGMVAAGLVFLYLALDAYTDRKYKKGRG